MSRIAHIITRLELGGAQQNTLYCVSHHDRRRYQVFLFAGPGGILDQEALAIADAEVVLIPALKHPIRPWQDLRALLELARLLKEHEIDLVHTHSSKAGIIGRLAARLAGVRVVVHTVHGWSFNPTQAPVLRWLYILLERIAATRTDLLITVAALHTRIGLQLGIGHSRQYQVIRSGIDSAYFSAKPAQPLLPRRPDELAIGTIACLKPQKDPLTLVRAAALVIADLPRAHFYIAGDGQLRGQIEALSQQLGIGDRVHLLGWVRDIRAFLHDLDVFVLSSRFEGLPRAVLQAAAAQVPIVATAVDGTPEVIRDGITGLLAEPGNHEQIAAQIRRLVDTPALRQDLVRAAAEQARTGSFEISQMLAELETAYDQLLAGEQAGS